MIQKALVDFSHTPILFPTTDAFESNPSSFNPTPIKRIGDHPFMNRSSPTTNPFVTLTGSAIKSVKKGIRGLLDFTGSPDFKNKGLDDSTEDDDEEEKGKGPVKRLVFTREDDMMMDDF